MKKLLFLLFPISVFAQTEIPLNDLNAFKNPSTNWTIVGGISGDYQATTLNSSDGKGILYGTAKGAKYQANDDLIFKLEHGDIKLSLDFMIPKGSNSGVYLQGRYEVQILDSWLKKEINDGDCGAIYHRWDETRGAGKEGYEGHAPRQNTVKAPGLWNHLEIDFKAPTFDASGKKTSNARFNKVVLNGIIIHENIELLGVTRGAIASNEVANGPIRIQGDHGPVAFKNIQYEVFNKTPASFSTTSYEYYQGKYANLQTGNAKPVKTGIAPQPTMKLAEAKSDYLLKFQGKITIPETDNYTFTTNWTGTGALLIDNDTITKGDHWYSEDVKGSKKLTAGEHNYTLIHAKDFGWGPKALGCFIERIGTAKQGITERTSLPEPEATPLIEVKVGQEPVLQRSFVIYGDKKKTHAISVGLPSGLSYSYDLNQGGYLQLWRGKFLDATQMWYDRGEPQISTPMGVTVQQNDKFPLAILANETAVFPDTLTKNDLKYKGYRFQKYDFAGQQIAFPDFMFEYKGIKVKDTSLPMPQNEGISRKLSFETIVDSKLYALLAEGSTITNLGNSRFAIDNQLYYLQVNASEASKVIIRESKGKKQLLLPLAGMKELSYQLIF